MIDLKTIVNKYKSVHSVKHINKEYYRAVSDFMNKPKNYTALLEAEQEGTSRTFYAYHDRAVSKLLRCRLYHYKEE